LDSNNICSFHVAAGRWLDFDIFYDNILCSSKEAVHKERSEKKDAKCVPNKEKGDKEKGDLV